MIEMTCIALVFISHLRIKSGLIGDTSYFASLCPLLLRSQESKMFRGVPRTAYCVYLEIGGRSVVHAFSLMPNGHAMHHMFNVHL